MIEILEQNDDDDDERKKRKINWWRKIIIRIIKRIRNESNSEVGS